MPNTATAEANVLPAFRNMPVPTLTIEGMTATFTGVRWVFGDQCWSCHHTTYLPVDGGTVTVTIDHYRSNTGKTERTRWVTKEHAPKLDTIPTACEACGTDPAFTRVQGHPRGFWKGSAHGFWRASALQDQAYRTLRANFPELSAKADRAAGIIR